MAYCRPSIQLEQGAVCIQTQREIEDNPKTQGDESLGQKNAKIVKPQTREGGKPHAHNFSLSLSRFTDTQTHNIIDQLNASFNSSALIHESSTSFIH